MPKSIVLLAPTTGAITSGQFMVDNGGGVMLISNPLVGTESVAVQIYDDAKLAWYDLILDGFLQTLDVNTNSILITGIGVYRVNKSVTVSTVGVTVLR